MRLFLISIIILLLSCNGKSSSEDVKEEDTAIKELLTNDTVSIAPTGTKQNQTALETEINKILQEKFQGKWKVLNDSTANWMKDEFDYFIAPKRKYDPDYPYICKGDYNADGKPDYAAIITDANKTSYQIAIFPADGEIILWKEDVEGSAIENLSKTEVLGFEGEKEKKVTLKSDGINVVFFEKSSYVIYWNGASFKNIWTGD